MRNRLLFVSVVISVLAAAGCGGGSPLGTVPRDAAMPIPRHDPHAVVVHLHGLPRGNARLQAADAGQKTAVALTLHGRSGAPMTASVAHGTCRKPTALTSVTMLGRVRASQTSWTVPTPFAQLRAGRFVIVVRSTDRGVAACGEG